jgi:hypothetical protein
MGKMLDINIDIWRDDHIEEILYLVDINTAIYYEISSVQENFSQLCSVPYAPHHKIRH